MYTGKNEVLVSIVCLAFNHEEYIRSALDGFVKQVCSFKYEIIIHDDASTDGTADIIREYEKRYPDLFFPIYQTENQYSKKVKIFPQFILPNVRGKYMAICEGDDYWIDPYKLQRQIDYMENHDDCTFCFTNAWVEDLSKQGQRRSFIPWNQKDAQYYQEQDKQYTLHDSYELSFIPAASFVFKTENEKNRFNDLPRSCPTGDLKRRLYHTSLGHAYYFHDKTCVYRENVPNSRVTSWRGSSKKKTAELSRQVIEMLNELDDYTKGIYSEGLNHFKEIHYRAIIGNSTSLKIFSDAELKKVFAKYHFSEKIHAILWILFPEKLYYRLKKLKSKITEGKRRK